MSLHPYLYCSNDPVNRTDPSGELWGAAVRARRTVLGVSAYYSGMYMGLKAAASPWDVMDVAIASNKFRESYFDPANLNRPINWGFSGDFNLFNVLEGLGNKIANACEWKGLALCVGKEIGIDSITEATAFIVGELSCKACISPFFTEPTTKTITCAMCTGYKIWHYTSGLRTISTVLNLGSCVMENCDQGIYSLFQ